MTEPARCDICLFLICKQCIALRILDQPCQMCCIVVKICAGLNSENSAKHFECSVVGYRFLDLVEESRKTWVLWHARFKGVWELEGGELVFLSWLPSALSREQIEMRTYSRRI